MGGVSRFMRKKKNDEVPKQVKKKFENALSQLPERRKRNSFVVMKYLIVIAAIVVLAGVGIINNPELIYNIPFLENMLGRDREEDSDLEPDIENPRISFSASEIYSDGYSVFITAEIHVEEGGLSNIPGNTIYLMGQYCLTGEERVYEMSNDNLHGEVLDDNTFVGQMKLDLEDVITQAGVLELNLSTIGFDDITMPTAPGIAHRFEGEWCYEIPFEVDVEQSKIITINQQENGFVLEKVLCTPYQFVTFFERPYENAELYFEVFNQDCEALPWGEEKNNQMIFELDDTELSEVHIYVFDKYDDWNAMHQGKREDNPIAQNAIFNAEVQIK